MKRPYLAIIIGLVVLGLLGSFGTLVYYQNDSDVDDHWLTDAMAAFGRIVLILTVMIVGIVITLVAWHRQSK